MARVKRRGIFHKRTRSPKALFGLGERKKAKKGKKAEPKPSLSKNTDNPVISGKAENGWEAWQTFNPTAILLDDKVHILYRAIGKDGISRLGCAISEDGFNIQERLPYPVYEHPITGGRKYSIYSYLSGGSWGGCEDPRIVRVGDEDTLYMTYTAVDGGLRVGMTSIDVEDFLKRGWRWKFPVFISPPGEVHNNWMLFPEKIKGKYAILHSIRPTVSIEYVDSLDFGENDYFSSPYHEKTVGGAWDTWVRAAGPPPIKTKEGWLLFYHAVDKKDPGKYKVGAMLLDLEDPTKILHRANAPILEPTEDYENIGFKGGIVYASGAVVKDGTLFVYYGGADSHVCVAYAKLDTFLKELKKDQKPKLMRKILKRRNGNR